MLVSLFGCRTPRHQHESAQLQYKQLQAFRFRRPHTHTHSGDCQLTPCSEQTPSPPGSASPCAHHRHVQLLAGGSPKPSSAPGSPRGERRRHSRQLPLQNPTPAGVVSSPGQSKRPTNVPISCVPHSGLSRTYAFPGCDSDSDDDLEPEAGGRTMIMHSFKVDGCGSYRRAKLVETAFEHDDVYKQMTPEQQIEYRSAYDKHLSKKERSMLGAILSPPVVRPFLKNLLSDQSILRIAHPLESSFFF